jgi:cation diffusion facilitator CzcD-associated flavoprotein CzcO
MGGGVRFLHAFSDILQDMEANLYVCDFIKEKIADIVKDPEKRRKLMPKELYARRPICDNGYYATFNNEKVDLVSLEETPITEVTSRGIKTSDNVEREFDVIVLATGFGKSDFLFCSLFVRTCQS